MIDEDSLHDLAEALQELDAAISYSWEQVFQAMQQLAEPFAECLRQALEDINAGTMHTPRKKLPRPPRYAGPTNKGREWTRQPPRLARSCCRKNRR